MVNVPLLEYHWKKAGYPTQQAAAKAIGVPKSTFCRWCKEGIFTTDVVELMTTRFRIEDPVSVFIVTKH